MVPIFVVTYYVKDDSKYNRLRARLRAHLRVRLGISQAQNLLLFRTRDAAENWVQFLESNNTEKIKYLIITIYTIKHMLLVIVCIVAVAWGILRK